MQQIITWANVGLDLSRRMVSLGHNDLIRLMNEIAVISSYMVNVKYISSIIRDHV